MALSTGFSVEQDFADRCFETQTLAFEAAGDDSRAMQFTIPDPTDVDTVDKHTNVPFSVVQVTAPEIIADAFGAH